MSSRAWGLFVASWTRDDPAPRSGPTPARIGMGAKIKPNLVLGDDRLAILLGPPPGARPVAPPSPPPQGGSGGSYREGSRDGVLLFSLLELLRAHNTGPR